MKEKTFRIIQALRFPILFIVLLWIVHTMQFISGVHLGQLGIYPRSIPGIKGILTAPMIHGDWQHLISNTIPLAMLTLILFLFYKRIAMKSFLLIYLLTGLSVWLFARDVYHIGASGIVYGLVSFIFWNGIFRRNMKSIVLALIILLMYSSYFLGIVPGQEGISWESHLLGGIVGIAVSYIFKDQLEKDEIPETYYEEPEDERYFLPRDVFDKTKAERERERRQNYWNSDRTF